MKYILYFLFLALAAPECFGQSQITDTHSFAESLHPVQHPVWLGLTGGINYNQYRTATFFYPDIDPFVIPESGESGKSMFLGVSCEIPVGRYNQGMIVAQVLYDSKNGAFSTGSAKNISLDRFGFPGQRGDLTTNMNASLNYLTLALGYKYNFIASYTPTGPGVELSAYAGINFASSITQEWYVETYPDSKGYRDWQEATFTGIFEPNLIRAGLRAQVSYDISVTGNVLVTPLIGYDLPFTKVENSDKSWKASSVFAGISAYIGIGERSDE